MSVIIGAVVTEKSLRLTELGQYSFLITPRATKKSVAAEIQKLYKVTSRSVNIVTIPGKVKRRGKTSGKRAEINKAIVTLIAGQKIAEFTVSE